MDKEEMKAGIQQAKENLETLPEQFQERQEIIKAINEASGKKAHNMPKITDAVIQEIIKICDDPDSNLPHDLSQTISFENLARDLNDARKDIGRLKQKINHYSRLTALKNLKISKQTSRITNLESLLNSFQTQLTDQDLEINQLRGFTDDQEKEPKL